jgi:hypothetical protein
MRRFYWLSFVIAGACALCGQRVLEAAGRDENQMSLFRELTSDGPVVRHDESAVTERPSAVTAAGPTAPAPAVTAHRELPSLERVSSVHMDPAVRPTNFYGGESARQTMSQFPRRAAIRSNPQRATRRHPKPFETAEHEPTISPYLNLDRDDNDPQDIPSFLTIVLPQMQQREMNRTQQRELQQLRGAMQKLTPDAGAMPAYEATRSAGMGASARFMDTAQFYGGMR